ncbi:hemolysin-III related-domain-containing protein [Gigaspora rosea]|uniref:Hemolysin-III related-domain-containing protein n=1 Tax=Gigaspora rosea TaxID=44941 RepID=A0A397U8F6_9GLOM|nr:hemolysin-III related-domain-containing protein [Gigaspora rosea]
MPLFKRKLSSNNLFIEQALIQEKVSLVNNIDYIDSDPDINDQNESHFFSVIWSGNSKSLTCSFSELPHWLQDNVDILKGYRRPTFSYLKCLQSLFYLHNESVNIWSHLMGGVIFTLFSVITYSYMSTHPSINWWDFFALYCYLMGALICLFLSALFHTFSCHSETVCANWNRCDYIGIVFLIVGSDISIVYYAFYCHYILMTFYITLLCVLGCATIFVTIPVRFRTPEFRLYRAGLFAALGASACFPILHAVILYGLRLCNDVISLKWMIITGAIYLIGAVFYGYRIPERFFPGTFDIWGHSHQIFHFLVVFASLAYYYGLIQAMSYWHENNHECKVDIGSMKIRQPFI